MISTTENLILERASINKLIELKTTDLGRVLKLLYTIKDTSQILTDDNNKPYYSDTLCEYLDMNKNKFYVFIRLLVAENILYYGPCKGTYNKVYIFNPLIARKYEHRIDSYALSLFKSPLSGIISKLV